MKVAYDPRTDTLSVILRDDARVATSDEVAPEEQERISRHPGRRSEPFSNRARGR